MPTRSLVLLVVLLILLGCSRPGPPIAEVCGVVTVDGKPLPNATVMFMPVANGRSSIGATDHAGHYRLIFNLHEMGALIGEHDVSITTAGADESGRNTPELVPAKYRSPGALKATVKPVDNTINFEL